MLAKVGTRYKCVKEFASATTTNPVDIYQTCADVGAQIIVPQSQLENDAYRDVFTGNIHIGITDVKEEGVWKNLNNGLPATWLNWAPNEGHVTGEPFVIIASSQSSWHDGRTGSHIKIICEKQPFNHCKLKAMFNKFIIYKL